MTKISPLNEKIILSRQNLNGINNKTDKHDMAYKDLIVQSAVIKPNKAKAVLVKENFIQSISSSIKDTFRDIKHFFVAAKTGKMDDNSLGRINDLGMKFGGLLIATFLASKARTKTEGIMQYVGGSAFFASMALWPKLFINLPARLIHGFRIDQKYISAQGEKKDFFLDNQFLPWDAFSEDELRQNAKRAGIDYDSENGDEKIKRKMQKTALQNRTLWMATAGFATPLMTALFGDFIEPKIKNAVIQKGFKQSQTAMKDLDTTLNQAKPIVRNVKEINDIISQYQASKIDFNEMLNQVSKMLTFDLQDVFSDSDDIKAVRDFKFSIEPDQLIAMRSHISTIEDDNIAALLKTALSEASSNEVAAESDLLKALGKAVQVQKETSESKDLSKVFEMIAEKFAKSEHKTLDTLAEIIKQEEKEQNVNLSELKQKLGTISFKYNDEEFFETIKDLNKEMFPQIRGRLKKYLSTVLNPVIGFKDESIYTGIYRDAMQKALLRDAKSIDSETLKEIQSSAKGINNEEGIKRFYSVAAEAMSKMYDEIASIKDDTEYKEAIQKLLIQDENDELSKYVSGMTDSKIIEKIFPQKLPFDDSITEELKTDFTANLEKNIKHFSEFANTNIAAIKSRVLISLNLERRIKSNEFENALKEAGLLSDENSLEDLIQKARYMVYRGSVASDACEMEFKNEHLYKKLVNVVYNPEYYKTEQEVSPNLKQVLNRLLDLKTKAKDNNYGTGLAKLEAAFVTNIINNRAWKKIFVPMAAGLVAITLLVQPFFGNIKKEFPEKKEGGN